MYLYCFARFVRVSVLVILPLLLASPVHGQNTSNSGSGSSTTTVVKNVDEVAIDFVVRNKNKPVLDLKPEDLVVTDDGSAVKLSALRLVRGNSGANHLVTFLFDPLDPSAGTNAHDVAKKILKLIFVLGIQHGWASETATGIHDGPGTDSEGRQRRYQRHPLDSE